MWQDVPGSAWFGALLAVMVLLMLPADAADDHEGIAWSEHDGVCRGL